MLAQRSGAPQVPPRGRSTVDRANCLTITWSINARCAAYRTARHYSSCLAHVIAFAELPATVRRWRLARDIDRDFCKELRLFLFDRQVTPNGRPGARAKAMSAGQIHNVLDALRSAFNWAVRPDVGKLPAGWINPLTAEIVGQKPSKDPLRPVKLPVEMLPLLIAAMDEWQLCHLGLICLLPPRPDEMTGVLVGDVDFEGRDHIRDCAWAAAISTKVGSRSRFRFQGRRCRC